jgi:hypothetical protein
MKHEIWAQEVPIGNLCSNSEGQTPKLFKSFSSKPKVSRKDCLGKIQNEIES